MRARSRLLAVLVTTVAALSCAAPVAGADIILPPPGFCLGPRTVDIGDHRGYEGTKATGSTAFTFTITSTGCANAGSVYFSTLPAGRARIGPDLTGVSGKVFFAQGDMSARTINIAVRPDSMGELTETFGVALCLDTGFLAFDRQRATGWIINDDPAPIQTDDAEYPNFHCSE